MSLMLLAKRKSTHIIVNADFVEKSYGPFLCPICDDEVSLRKSHIRLSHFAHRPLSACAYGAPETDAHRQCKKEIFEALMKEPGVKNAALERSLKTCRPDVSARINGVPVAIEVQISTLSLETIIRRTAEYARRGIYVLWLLQWTPYLDGERYSPRLWEKWIHASYFGRVYYWTHGLNVVSYHFEPHYDQVGGNSWHSSSGKLMTGKRYKRKSKRYRQPVRGKVFNLARDFVPKNRELWTGGNFLVPKAKLFIERSN